MFFKLHNYKSILGHKLHYLGTAALGFGTLAITQPWMIVAGTGVMGAVLGISIKASKNIFENKLEKHPDKHKFSPNLKKIVNRLYNASKLDKAKAAIYNFKTRKSATGKESIFDGALDEIAKLPNAAAFNMGKPVVMISDPLLELLNDEEEHAVLAHEFTHATALHQHIGMPHKLLTGVIKVSAGLATLTAAISSGETAIVTSIASVLALHKAVKKIPPKWKGIK